MLTTCYALISNEFPPSVICSHRFEHMTSTEHWLYTSITNNDYPLTLASHHDRPNIPLLFWRASLSGILFLLAFPASLHQ